MKLPVEVIELVNEKLSSMTFGEIKILASVHDGKAKFRIIQEISIIPGKDTSGSESKNADGV